MIDRKQKQNGFVLISLVVVLPFLILIAAHYLQLATSSYNLARKDQMHSQAQFGTDASIDYAVEQINADPNWAGTVSPVELHNDGNTKVTYEVSVTNNSTTTKTINATGYAYSPVTRSTPNSTVKIKVDLRAVTSGNFSLVTGVGGLYMSNSAKILGGDVYVNGEISMSNSAQIGLSSNPVNLSVAHQTCPTPANSSYPQICGSGNGEPIELNNSAHIYGDVKANNQTDGAGMSNPGLTAGSGVAALPLPPHDRSAQKAAVTSEITGAAASCWGTQTKTWAANTKIVGNVTLSNSCQVTVLGDVWITGNLNASNSTRIIAADSLGSTRPNIMVDGSSGATFSNSTKLVSNASATGFQVVTYRSDASCSPDCANVTGTDLYNSRNDTTISLSNNTEGPDTIFYARWTRVQINNSGQIGALVGQTVQLSNSGTITFGTSIPGTGETFWVINGYRRSFE